MQSGASSCCASRFLTHILAPRLEQPRSQSRFNAVFRRKHGANTVQKKEEDVERAEGRRR